MILTVTTIILLPALVVLYDERTSIQQEEIALFLLKEVITDWVYERNDVFQEEIKVESTMYNLSFNTSNDDQKLTVCVHWIGANDRIYERCESGKR